MRMPILNWSQKKITKTVYFNALDINGGVAKLSASLINGMLTTILKSSAPCLHKDILVLNFFIRIEVE